MPCISKLHEEGDSVQFEKQWEVSYTVVHFEKFTMVSCIFLFNKMYLYADYSVLFSRTYLHIFLTSLLNTLPQILVI